MSFVIVVGIPPRLLNFKLDATKKTKENRLLKMHNFKPSKVRALLQLVWEGGGGCLDLSKITNNKKFLKFGVKSNHTINNMGFYKKFKS